MTIWRAFMRIPGAGREKRVEIFLAEGNLYPRSISAMDAAAVKLLEIVCKRLNPLWQSVCSCQTWRGAMPWKRLGFENLSVRISRCASGANITSSEEIYFSLMCRKRRRHLRCQEGHSHYRKSSIVKQIGPPPAPDLKL
jgi:hypothetical protein